HVASGCISNHSARPGIENDGQIDEDNQYANVGNVCHPKLIRPVRTKLARQVREWRRGCAVACNDEATRLPGLKSSLSHYPRHALVIDDETLTPQLPSHPPVPVPDVTLADSLNALDDYILIGTQTPFRAIVAGAARHFHEPARLRATEPFGPLTIEELASFADRAGGSVFLSSSFSIVSWPTLRSRAAIRASYSSKEA